MADVNANIGVNIDTSKALGQLKDLQRQISQFHSSIAKSSSAAALAQRDLQRNFLSSVNAIGSFSAELRNVKTTSESFTSSLEKNKFSMREYFRYAGASTKTFGRLFKSEYDTIGKVAEDRVKKLQTQYIKMGRDASGAMKAIAIIPNQLDMGNFATQTQIAAQKQALFNQLMKQGSTNLLNFGKNTQWAGRQLMVGFTLPLMAVGSAASQAFMKMEAQALKFKKVYGDLFTPQEETQQALADIQALASEFTKYGIAVADTVGLAADAAAAGFKGLDLQRQTTEATRLSVLGQIDNQQALQTTISLQNAFGTSSANLANSIDFLNAVENQTVLSLDDVTIAIPKVAPIIKQLGGDVKDLAFFLTAMKEGGVNASEGANALKSGLASLINPSTKARAMFQGLGIDINGIVENNKGDLKATVIGFAQALDTLAPLQRARAIEQMFGKFQFARLSTLFQNVTKDGTQASRVLDLAGSSVQSLASLSNKELGITANSSMNKFKKSVEDLKAAIIPVGQAFLEAVTPVLDFVSKIASRFADLSDGTKKAITVMVTVIGGLGPILLMTFGLLANGVANIMKLFLTLRTGYQNLTGQSKNLGEQTQYMTTEQLEAAAAAHSLNQSHARLTQQFTVETAELNKLIAAYQSAAAAGARFAAINPGMMKIPRKLASGGIVNGPGNGTSDSIPAMLSNGEAVIPAANVKKYPGMVAGLVAGNIPGFMKGVKRVKTRQSSDSVPSYGDFAVRYQDSQVNQSQQTGTESLPNVLSILSARVSESRGQLGAGLDSIIGEYEGVTQKFVDNLNEEFIRTESTIVDSNERYGMAWQHAGKTVEAEVNKISSEAERGAVRKVFGLDPDRQGTIATDLSFGHGFRGRKKRYEDGPKSYTDPAFKKASAQAYEKITGAKPVGMDIGHVLDVKTRKKMGIPTSVSVQELEKDAKTSQASINALRSSIGKYHKEYDTYIADVQNKVKAGSVETQKSAEQVAKSAVSATAKSAGTASPSKKTIPIGQDIARGLEVGMKKQTPKVVAEANKMTDAAIKGTRTRRRSVSGGGTVGPNGQILPPGTRIPNKRTRRGAASSGGTVGPNGRISTAPTFIQTPENTRLLPIVPGETSQTLTRGQMLSSKLGRGAGKVGGLGGGMGLLGANMALGSMPDFAGKGVIQSTMTGANMGMLFGPWGTAAGAAIGLVTSSLVTLISKEKEHDATVKATFTASAEVIKMFGNTALDTTLRINNVTDSSKTLRDSLGSLSPEIQNMVASIKALPENDPISKFIKNISSSKSDLQSITGSIRSQVTSAISTGGLDPKNAQQYVQVLLAAANRTKDFGAVWQSVSKNVVDAQTATTTSLNKLDTMVQKNGDSWSYNLNVGNKIAKSYKELTSIQKAFADQMLNMFSIIGSGSLTFEQMTQRINGIKASSVDAATGVMALSAAIINTGNKDAIDRLNKIKEMYKATGREAQLTAGKLMLINAAMQVSSVEKINKWADTMNLGAAPFDVKMERYISSPQFKKDWAETQKVLASAAGGGVGGGGGTNTDVLSKQAKLTIARLQKELDLLKTKRDTINESNNGLKRQYEYQQKLMQLQQEAVQAKISGNYIGAAIIDQQKSFQRAEFNKETASLALDKKITELENRISGLTAGARVTNAETALNKAKAKGKAMGGLIKGPGTGTSDSIMARFAMGGLPQLRVSNGEYIVKAASVKNYGVGFMDAINNQKVSTSSSSTSMGGAVYNIDMTINGGSSNPSEIANQVIRKLKLETSKNNKSNVVMM
jgi:TP901 family phage tail tape measure protein